MTQRQHLQDYILTVNEVNRDRLLLAHSPTPHVSRIWSSQISAGGPDHWQDHTGKDQIIFCPKLTGPLGIQTIETTVTLKLFFQLYLSEHRLNQIVLGHNKNLDLLPPVLVEWSQQSQFITIKKHIIYHPLPIFFQLMLNWSSSRSLQHVHAQVFAWMWKVRKQKRFTKSTESL